MNQTNRKNILIRNLSFVQFSLIDVVLTIFDVKSDDFGIIVNFTPIS